nr:MAG TPA: cell division protein [Bacteriophage sp.]
MKKNNGEIEASRMPHKGAVCRFNKYFKYIAILLIISLSVGIIVLAIENSELKEENKIHIDDKVQLTMNIQDLEKENEILQENVVQLESEVETGNESLIEYEKKLRAYETEKKKQQVVQVSTSNNGSMKSYMSYRAITNTRSKQYQLQQQAVTDPNTGVRTINGDYCIAIGSGWGYEIGTKVLVTLQGGKTFNAIVADAKADAHTQSDNKTTSYDGSVVEFIVEVSSLPKAVRISGNLGVLEIFNGGIISITKR